MIISKMKLKYSSLFCIPFVVMLGVFLFISDCINCFGVEILAVYFGPLRSRLEEPCQVFGDLIV